MFPVRVVHHLVDLSARGPFSVGAAPGLDAGDDVRVFGEALLRHGWCSSDASLVVGCNWMEGGFGRGR